MESSGCFGGDPDIVPHRDATGLPVNTQVRIARRAPAAVVWTGPDGTPVPVRERRIGAGAAAALVLAPAAPLAAGWHTIRTREPTSRPASRWRPVRMRSLHAWAVRSCSKRTTPPSRTAPAR